LSVNQHGRELVVSCRDDGQGLDTPALRRALTDRGNPEAAGLDRETLLGMLTTGGVSTKDSADAISGRGVGLDVVREAAQQLDGSVRLFDGGPGFVVEIRLPLAAAAIEGLVVSVNDSTVVVPLSAVVATCRIAEVERHAGGEAIAYGEELLPLLRVVGAQAQPRCAVIVRNNAGAYALGCDRLHGVQTVIVRPLPRLVPAQVPVLGASLSAASVPRLVLDPERLSAFVRPRSGSSPVPHAPAPVLVIDDSLTTRILEQSILESAGYAVELATCAEQGLEKARASAYSLFLVDVEMPGMSGFEFVAATRADPDLCKIPAVLVSSRSGEDDFERGRRAGASGYIVKDRFDQRELLRLIEELLDT
jgi:two-component system chemotaxis sensor kinase CheA